MLLVTCLLFPLVNYFFQIFFNPVFFPSFHPHPILLLFFFLSLSLPSSSPPYSPSSSPLSPSTSFPFLPPFPLLHPSSFFPTNFTCVLYLAITPLFSLLCSAPERVFVTNVFYTMGCPITSFLKRRIILKLKRWDNGLIATNFTGLTMCP